MYARAGIADYWIVNLVESGVEVHRDPGGEGYGTTARLGSGEAVSPLAATESTVAICDLLP